MLRASRKGRNPSQKKTPVSRIRGVLKDNFKFSHYLWSRYFGDTSGYDLNELTRVPLLLYSTTTFELYDLANDPNELTNLLPYRDKETSALWSALRDPARRDQLNDLLRTLAKYQTVADDPMGVDLVDIRVERTAASTAVIDWDSVRADNGRPRATSTEVVFRQRACGSCQVFEYDYKHAQSDHHVELTGLAANREYEALIFSITQHGNGGVARYLIPATPGDLGRRNPSGWPPLNYVWWSYETEVKGWSGPAPLPRGQCRITSARGYVFADYETECGICIDDCRLRQTTNPNRTCVWNGQVFHRPQ